MEVLLAFVLCGYVAAWWLAIRIVFGNRFGVFLWMPVAWAAIGMPIVLVDVEWSRGQYAGWPYAPGESRGGIRHRTKGASPLLSKEQRADGSTLLV
jgi:hypothetical protein